jgi:hypothetical protein
MMAGEHWLNHDLKPDRAPLGEAQPIHGARDRFGSPVTVILDGKSLHIERFVETWRIYRYGQSKGVAWDVELSNGRQLIIRSERKSEGGWSWNAYV